MLGTGQIALNISQSKVSSQARKLKVQWSIDAAQDLAGMHNGMEITETGKTVLEGIFADIPGFEVHESWAGSNNLSVSLENSYITISVAVEDQIFGKSGTFDLMEPDSIDKIKEFIKGTSAYNPEKVRSAFNTKVVEELTQRIVDEMAKEIDD